MGVLGDPLRGGSGTVRLGALGVRKVEGCVVIERGVGWEHVG